MTAFSGSSVSGMNCFSNASFTLAKSLWRFLDQAGEQLGIRCLNFQPKYNVRVEEFIGNAFGSPGQPAFPKMRACGKLFSSSQATGLMDFSTNKFPNNESAVQFLAKANEHTLTHSERRWKAHIQDALIWKQVYFCVWGVLFSLPSI